MVAIAMSEKHKLHLLFRDYVNTLHFNINRNKCTGYITVKSDRIMIWNALFTSLFWKISPN